LTNPNLPPALASLAPTGHRAPRGMGVVRSRCAAALLPISSKLLGLCPRQIPTCRRPSTQRRWRDCTRLARPCSTYPRPA